MECCKWEFKRWGCKQIRGYLRKKVFFLRFLDFPGAPRTVLKRAKKRQKKGEKGQKRPISGKGGQTPLKPPFVTPPFAAASNCKQRSWIRLFSIVDFEEDQRGSTKWASMNRPNLSDNSFPLQKPLSPTPPRPHPTPQNGPETHPKRTPSGPEMHRNQALWDGTAGGLSGWGGVGGCKGKRNQYQISLFFKFFPQQVLADLSEDTEGVELLKDLRRVLKNPPPPLKKPPPPSEEAAHLLFPVLNASS